MNDNISEAATAVLEAPIKVDQPAVVVFGRDESGKPHASSFTESEVALAKKAAALMGMSVMPVKTDVEKALAATVPKGRLFASGKGFVPFVKGELFAKLEAACPQSGKAAKKPISRALANGSAEPSAIKPGPNGVATTKHNGSDPVRQPSDWDNIQGGSIVLAASAPKHTEWFECLVLAVADDDLLTLRYCDWPKEPPFTRPRTEIALMRPLHVPEPPLEVEPLIDS